MTSILILTLAVAVIINLVAFLFAYIKQTDKLTDITWAITFIVLVLVNWLNTSSLNIYKSILGLMVIVWAVRLGIFLLYRVLKKGKDKRFDERRSSFFIFLRFWLGQALAAWILLIPLTIAINKHRSFSDLAAIGLFIWLIALIFETTADIEKLIFNTKPKNKGKWINDGLWRLSRHPNYFGEILIWVGIYIYSLDALNSFEAFVAILSPLTIFVLLRYISGVPILEANADKKWGENPQYIEYKNKTNLLIPFFRH